MKDLKIPIICGTCLFVIIFFINLIIGNGILIVLLRSLISGLIFGGIIFGLIYFFNNYININELLETEERNDDSNPVDIMVDEESADNDSEKDSDSDTESYNDALTESGMNGGAFEEAKSGFEENEIKDASLDKTDDYKADDFNDVDNIAPITNPVTDQKADLGNSRDDDEFNFGSGFDTNLSDTYEINQPETMRNKEEEIQYSEIDSKSLKDKIGVEVSFEDVAKAIRTKLKKDD